MPKSGKTPESTFTGKEAYFRCDLAVFTQIIGGILADDPALIPPAVHPHAFLEFVPGRIAVGHQGQYASPWARHPLQFRDERLERHILRHCAGPYAIKDIVRERQGAAAATDFICVVQMPQRIQGDIQDDHTLGIEKVQIRPQTAAAVQDGSLEALCHGDPVGAEQGCVKTFIRHVFALHNRIRLSGIRGQGVGIVRRPVSQCFPVVCDLPHGSDPGAPRPGESEGIAQQSHALGK